jgi:glycosyltransferase involved in cell wall biosynthesis
MKILYIGHYKDGTGWGDAAKNNIIALSKAGVDVVPRAISYNEKDSEPDEEISKLEQKSSEGCDICIQHTLPSNYVYDSNFKNIGYLATESSDFVDTAWQKNINMMDELWVPSEYVKNSCVKSGVTIPIKIAPHCLNIDSYLKAEDGAKISQLLNTFNFAFVGEFIERKNIQALIKAFHTEFHPKENVSLLIKTSGVDISVVNNLIQATKKGLKLREKYKEDIVISGKLEKKDYLSVLKQCHAFVMPSRGEGFCIPALEAMALGVPAIYTKGTAMSEFCIGSAVESHSVACFGGMGSLPNIYTANSNWQEINIRDLQAKMRNAYTKGTDIDKKERCQNKAKEYSHENIGKLFKELLNDK